MKALGHLDFGQIISQYHATGGKWHHQRALVGSRDLRIGHGGITGAEVDLFLLSDVVPMKRRTPSPLPTAAYLMKVFGWLSR